MIMLITIQIQFILGGASVIKMFKLKPKWHDAHG